MALKTINENPTTSDTVLFDLYTTNANGDLVNPYEVNNVTIYFVEREYGSKGFQTYDKTIKDIVSTFYYKQAVPVKIIGTEDYPAWLSSDTANAFLSKIDFDEDGNSDVGHFQYQWVPELVREGDYFICHTWTPIPAGDSFSRLITFYLGGDLQPPAIPSHRTNPKKYPTLLDRYTPDMFKQFLINADLTPDVIQRLNLAVADGFTDLENFFNQIIDLLDANVINEALLPYLANFFRMKLRSQDPALWRRQVRTAIPLYKRKGTIGGLKEALAEVGVVLRKLTYYWQVVSKATWQDGFVVKGETEFQLSKKALLPTETDNFHIYYRPNGSNVYEELSLEYVTFTTVPGTDIDCIDNTPDITYVTWRGENVYSNPITLQEGDVLRVVYKVATPIDQQLESYIQTLPLADQRDEKEVTLPIKNWNVRLIAEDDFLFDVICPSKHAFVYPLVYGRIRTEFPYSENIYNMEEYNGSTRDSTDPCDLDGSFYDICNSCRSSKISVDVEIEQLSNDRITETEEVIKDFIPFHTIVQSVNYVGLQDELIPPPMEELECLIQYDLEDNVIFSQYDFNRLIHDGLSYDDVIKRDMLADADAVASGNDGVGYNLTYRIFSPGINFVNIGIDEDGNLLEVLSGTNEGVYQLTGNADVVGLTQYPLDQSGFPFRFSNIRYEEMGVSIYQDNLITLSDPEIDFSLFGIPNNSTWVIKIESGPYTGTYPIKRITSDNTLILSGWTSGTATGVSYKLNAPGNINVLNSDEGSVEVQLRGRLETDLIKDEYDVKNGDYVLFDNQQFKILYFAAREEETKDKVYIEGYTDGDQIGVLNIKIIRRLASGVGYFKSHGLKLTTTINYETSLGIQDGANPVANPVENSDFKDNYFVLIDTIYYQMSNIDGQTIYLKGPIQDWGLTGETTGLSYTIIQLVNQEATILEGRTGEFNTFGFVDRRGDGSTFVIEEDLSVAPMAFRMQMLNKAARGELVEDIVRTKESISYTVVMKDTI